MTTSRRTWHYVVKDPATGAWWADVILREDGFFAAVSDWENYSGYAYRWPNTGRPDFRDFIVEISSHYLLSKLAPTREYDAEATRGAVVAAVVELGERERKDAEEALLELWSLDTEVDFAMWCGETSLVEAHQYQRSCHQAMPLAFCEKVLPLLQDAVRAELAAEREQQLATERALMAMEPS